MTAPPVRRADPFASPSSGDEGGGARETVNHSTYIPSDSLAEVWPLTVLSTTHVSVGRRGGHARAARKRNGSETACETAVAWSQRTLHVLREGPAVTAGDQRPSSFGIPPGAPMDTASTLVALSGLRFTEGRASGPVPSVSWKVGCNPRLAVVDTKAWSYHHEEVLVEALRALSALGGLPAGPVSSDPESWANTLTTLRSLRELLRSTPPLPSDQPFRAGRSVPGRSRHECRPGYAPSSCCRQVRFPILSRRRSASATSLLLAALRLRLLPALAPTPCTCACACVCAYHRLAAPAPAPPPRSPAPRSACSSGST